MKLPFLISEVNLQLSPFPRSKIVHPFLGSKREKKNKNDIGRELESYFIRFVCRSSCFIYQASSAELT